MTTSHSDSFNNSVEALASTFNEYNLSVSDLNIRLAVIGMEQFKYLLSELRMYIVANEYQLYLSTGTTDQLLSECKLVALHLYIMESTGNDQSKNSGHVE